MNPLVEITKAFTSFWLWPVVFAFTGAFMWLLNDALGKKLNRQQLSRLLLHRRYAALYQELLQGAMARVDRWLTPTIGPSLEMREAEGRRPWSWPLFDLSLRLAMAYPLLTLVVAWGVLGTDGKLGSLVVLPTSGWSVRIAALVGLAVVCCLVYRSRRAKVHGKRYTSTAYLLFAGVGVGVVASAFAFAGVGAVAFAVAGVGTVAGALAVAGVGSFTGAFAAAGAFAVAGAVAGAVAVAVAVAGTSAVAGIAPIAIGVSISFAISFAGAVALAVALAFAVEGVAKGTRLGLLAYVGFVVLLLGALATAVRMSPEIRVDGAKMIVFLGLLPLLNAVFDFLSIGLTRSLLRRGAISPGSGALVWALGDLLSALGFFALLGLALVTMVFWLNGQGAAPLLDLSALFADIRADPGAYWWLYVTIFSTLLPTLLHLVLASFSALLAIMPESMALFIRRQLPKIEVDAMAKTLAFWTLSTIGFLAIAAVTFGLYGLVIGVLAVFPYAGDWYLYAFERYAAWLGAPVVPVRPGWF